MISPPDIFYYEVWLMKYNEEVDVLTMEKINDLLTELPQYVKNYISNLAAGSKSRRTILNYLYDIRGFLTFMADAQDIDVMDLSADTLGQLNNFDFDDYFGSFRTGKSEGKARKLAALRSFYKFLKSYGFIAHNPLSEYSIELKQKKDPRRDLQFMNTEEVNQVMAGVTTGSSLASEHQKKCNRENQYRDTALFTLMLNTGIRLSECVGIDLTDVLWEEHKLVIHRKGGIDDIVFLNENAESALRDYIRYERAEDADDPALFLSNQKRRITPRSVQRIVKKYTESVVPDKNIHVHSLRKTFGDNLYQATHDIKLTQQALNHSDISVTAAHYITDNAENKKTAVEIIQDVYKEDS